MKIGITCYPTYGGSGAVATELGLELAQRGHEVHFVSYARPFRLDPFRERVFFHEVEMEDYPLFEHPPYSLALAVALHDTARKHELDLVHVHYAIPHATSAWIAHEMLGEERDLKIVTTLHGTDITLVGLHPSFHAITRFSILRSHGLTAVSKFLKRETVRDFTVPEERVEVIPNFIDTAVYRPGLVPSHRATLAPDGEKIVMHISNFRAVKRAEDVVSVFAKLTAKQPSRLVLVGDGPERPRVLMRAEELGVRDRVMFLGKHTSVHEVLSCADLFLLPSASESFGLVALEAMACGAPVVASNVGGLPEVIEHGTSGYMFDVGDIDAMAEAGLRIMGDDEHWRSLSEAGRALAEERFSSERVVPQYERYYEQVLRR
ncbi:MAG: N-acetyl-alpha-D-glucosaminyl L-malate synthase BshA [Gemmatimonadetes bacterium]|jgi:N-acetyl-alpha-D-glucosaminyl L-malate synthase BshA|nr:N-acetyl-alpha-D-glucosaminyl L-malate synthase BshA [Gemmatimonadota bacterium]HBD96859.1 N-acetyl-alpha-D-glucosaminyl L-malate synthase BshA [Gemmatimonadota bacterium]HIN50097.1 N-acetyl-alpha-D-glucosaminyl L-malate synthase BshA [Gemmatimonadota bacterium]